MKIFHVSDLNHGYTNQKTLFKDFNYKFEQGNMYAFMGPSGCGKSTLLYLLSGLLTPSQSGQIIFEQGGLRREPKNSFIFSEPFLIPELTCLENLTFCSYQIDQMNQLLEVLELKECLNQYPDSLSSGQKQRFSALRALLLAEDVLFADEPTSHLDKKRSKDFIEVMQPLVKEKGLIFLCVTHDQSLSSLFDKIIYL
jgi:putative ABC transport system ATP-binding protein